MENPKAKPLKMDECHDIEESGAVPWSASWQRSCSAWKCPKYWTPGVNPVWTWHKLLVQPAVNILKMRNGKDQLQREDNGICEDFVEDTVYEVWSGDAQ